MKITKIQDDGNRFIVYGGSGLFSRLTEVFEKMALGVSVTESDKATANILYTENNRDIILRLLYDHTDGTSVDGLKKSDGR